MKIFVITATLTQGGITFSETNYTVRETERSYLTEGQTRRFLKERVNVPKETGRNDCSQPVMRWKIYTFDSRKGQGLLLTAIFNRYYQLQTNMTVMSKGILKFAKQRFLR